MLNNALKSSATRNELMELVKNKRGREYSGSKFNKFERPERNKKYQGYCIPLRTSYAKKKPNNSSITRLERLLLSGFGMNSIKYYEHQPEMLWSYPSAGACYPVELYVVIKNAPPLEKGVFYYSAHDMALYKISNEDSDLQDTLLEMDSDDDIYIIFTAALWRSCWKYSYRGYQFTHIDAGHVMTNIRLLADTLGMDTSSYTQCNSRNISQLLKLDEKEEPIGLISIKNFNLEKDTSQTNAVSKEHLSRSYRNYPDQSNQFNWKPINGFLTNINGKITPPESSWRFKSVIEYDWNRFDTVLELIRRRRSSSNFKQNEIELSELNRIIEYISRSNFPIEITFVVNNVNSLEPGVYKLVNEVLVKEKHGMFAEKVMELCINQDIVKNASVVLFFSAKLGMENQEVMWKKRLIESGMLAQVIHLRVNELGLGYSCIGGYYDEEVKNYINLDSKSELLYAGVLGLDNSNNDVKRDRYYLNR